MERTTRISPGRPPRRAATLAAVLALGGGLLAAPDGRGEGHRYEVTVGKSRFIHLPRETTRIAVGNPQVAAINLLDPSNLHIQGQSLGTTNVVLCGLADCFATLDVEVTHDLNGLKAKLYELFPEERPKAYSSQGSIVLAGQVSSLEKADGIVAVARTFLHKGEEAPSDMQGGSATTVITGNMGGGSGRQAGSSASAPKGQGTDIINLLQVGGPQQVMLGVTVAEINRRLARRLKVDFSAVGTSGDFSAGAINGDALISALTQAINIAPGAINPAGLFFRFIGNDAAVRTAINAAKENGLAKILAEPNLTTMSGQDADFISGGEFPIPVPQNIGAGGVGTITVQFKEFGVGLKFLPVVLDSGRISLKVNISVTELSPENAVVLQVSGANTNFAVPALTKRGANTSLELGDGQTMGIAGLINDSLRQSISKFPGLGDIPILGQLFTSQDFLKNETELLIFVTPHLVKPMPADKIRLPTDTFVEPGDAEFYWMGRTEALNGRTTRGPGPAYGGLRGHFGQVP